MTRFAVLGPVRAWSDDEELSLGPRQQRRVLGLLVVRAGTDVSTQQFIDMLWDHSAPSSAMNSLHRFIGALRRILEPGLAGRSSGRFIHRRDGGYRLLTQDAGVDLAEFRKLAADAREAEGRGQRDVAVQRYGEALRRSRGRCADDGSTGGRFSLFAAIDEEYASVAREAAHAAIAFNRVGALLPAIRRAAEMNPVDEALQARLMLMLAAEGRQSDAFGLFHEVRGVLSRTLGVEPGAELRAAYAEVLRPWQSSQSASTPAGPVKPAQIPRDLPQFVGRGDDFDRADHLLHGSVRDGTMPIITIDGMPGVGKSTMAVHWAHRIASMFPDGQLYLDLRGHDDDATPMPVEDALRSLLSALGVPADKIPPGTDALAAFYRSHMAGRRTMVLLDNADRAEQVRPLLPGTGECLVIITSRASLTALFAAYGAQPLTLDLPPADDARTLLARRLPLSTSAEERVDTRLLDKVVAACGRLPLALTTVAAKAALHRELGFADLVDELRLLEGGLDAYADGAKPDLRTVMGWSIRALTAPAAHLLRMLSLHPGPDISLAAAASLAGVPVPAIQPLIGELGRAHLVTSRSRRLSLHVLVRAYARGLVGDVERAEAFPRLLEHYWQTAYAAHRVMSPMAESVASGELPPEVTVAHIADFRDAVDWFRAEHDPLRAMIDEAGPDAGPTVWKLATALLPFYQWSGLARAWLATMTSALRYAERIADHVGQAHLHRCVAGAYYYLGDHGRARDLLRKAQRMFAGLGLPAEQACVHIDIGLTLVGEPGRGLPGAGNPAAAEDEFLAARKLYTRAGNPKGIAGAVQGLAKCKAAVAEHAAAAHLFEQAMATYLSIDDCNGVSGCLLGLGNLAREAGDLPLSLEYLRRCVDMYRDVGNRSDEAFALIALGDSLAASDAMPGAVRAWRAALEILEDVRLPAAVNVRDRLRTGRFER